MRTFENTSEASLPHIEFLHQAIVVTVSKDYRNFVSVQSSLYDLSRNSTPFTEFPHTVLTHLSRMKWKLKKPQVVFFRLFKTIQEFLKKRKPPNLILRRPQENNYNIFNKHAFLTSNVMLPTLKPPTKPDSHRDNFYYFYCPPKNFSINPICFRCLWFQHPIFFN